ncbi:hypothetical protein WK81_27920 [Burkholderia ubonensis]|uniref:hypothetical protein n=1 Tax=Burkholderia ubonensis TaxID=101571 RepID=UPI00075BB261|nr:hypothetical protein [Burkholderia ubonensis]KVV36063.1 hypothetical protein WK81_27920 [Burkholderia ubonensis]
MQVKKVRQRQYEIAQAGTSVGILKTGDVWTCVAFAGVNGQGVGFLAHFDSFISALVVPEIVDTLRNEYYADFSNFELRMATGLAGCFNPLNWLTHLMLWWQLRKIGVCEMRTQIWAPCLFEKFEVEVDAQKASIQPVRRYYRRREKKDWQPRPPKSGSRRLWVKGWFWARWKTYRAK